MKTSRLIGAVCTCIAILSFNAGAVIVDKGIYTTDTATALDWLDLTETANMTYLEVTAQLGLGGAFEGWSYASLVQVRGFWDAFGGDSVHYNGFSTENNGLYDSIAPLWGDLRCHSIGCPAGDGYLFAITGERAFTGIYRIVQAYDDVNDPSTITQDLFDGTGTSWTAQGQKWNELGSALVRPTVVPIPTTIWLFSSGLLGLVGLARKKAHAT